MTHTLPAGRYESNICCQRTTGIYRGSFRSSYTCFTLDSRDSSCRATDEGTEIAGKRDHRKSQAIEI